jgi:hypothetical protein
MFTAAATIAAAPSRPARHAAPRYVAFGFEPTWSVVIEGGRMTFDPGDGHAESMPLPPRRPIRNGYRYVAPNLMVEVRHVRCESYSGRIFADTVRTTGAVEDGCGGTPIPPPNLADSSWTVQFVDRMRPPERSGRLRLEFVEGRMTLRATCHDYEGAYRERRPLLRVTSIAESRRVCPPSALERRIVAIMRTPMRMRFVDGDTMVLTNRTGSLRLLP